MIQLLLYYGLVNSLGLLAALGLGYMGPETFMAHFAAGFLSSLSCVLWIGVAMFYFIYSGQAINRAEAAGIASPDDAAYARLAKKRLFPWFIAAILSLIIGPFLGAAAQAKTGPLLAHHLASWTAAGIYWYSLYLARPFLTQTGEAINRILDRVNELRQAKIRAAGGNAQDSRPPG